MSSIKRYIVEYEISCDEDPNGEYCLYEDVEKLEAQNKVMKEALEALKLRIHFIGMPQEPMIDMSNQGGPERCPDWQHEIVLLENALEESK